MLLTPAARLAGVVIRTQSAACFRTSRVAASATPRCLGRAACAPSAARTANAGVLSFCCETSHFQSAFQQGCREGVSMFKTAPEYPRQGPLTGRPVRASHPQGRRVLRLGRRGQQVGRDGAVALREPPELRARTRRRLAPPVGRQVREREALPFLALQLPSCQRLVRLLAVLVCYCCRGVGPPPHKLPSWVNPSMDHGEHDLCHAPCF